MTSTDIQASDTPRTDALQGESTWLNVETREDLAWKHARDLERELAATNATIRVMRAARDEHLSRCQGENRL